jgi:hypothetical protein
VDEGPSDRARRDDCGRLNLSPNGLPARRLSTDVLDDRCSFNLTADTLTPRSRSLPLRTRLDRLDALSVRLRSARSLGRAVVGSSSGLVGQRAYLLSHRGGPMTVSSVLDAAGRRRSPATMPGYHAGGPPRQGHPLPRRRPTRSSPSCATPARTATGGEEIIAAVRMRRAPMMSASPGLRPLNEPEQRGRSGAPLRPEGSRRLYLDSRGARGSSKAGAPDSTAVAPARILNAGAAGVPLDAPPRADLTGHPAPTPPRNAPYAGGVPAKEFPLLDGLGAR